MQHTPIYGTVLIIIVAALSLVAGLVVVIATSPESIQLANIQQVTAAPHTATSVPVVVAQSETPTPTVTLGAAGPTATSTAPATQATEDQTQTTDTPEPPTVVPTETATGTAFPTLAPDAIALGQISTINNSTARLRSGPGLDTKVISAIQPGEYVQVLGGPTTVDDIDWIPVRATSGLNGWISADLVETLAEATP